MINQVSTNNPSSSRTSRESTNVRSTHPELEHLAATMPSSSVDSVRSQSRMSISHVKGLLNMPGQNNCFLNSAVQVINNID